jgi:hypothetical protein
LKSREEPKTKLSKLREFLTESESYIGALENRGDVWRRFLRRAKPADTIKETSPQSILPNNPLSKFSVRGRLKIN